MKTSIFDMNFTLPPLIGMHEVEKDMPMWNGKKISFNYWKMIHCQETDMKTSIFDMTFVLPPLIEMTEVEKDLAGNTMGCTLVTCTVLKHGLCC